MAGRFRRRRDTGSREVRPSFPGPGGEPGQPLISWGEEGAGFDSGANSALGFAAGSLDGPQAAGVCEGEGGLSGNGDSMLPKGAGHARKPDNERARDIIARQLAMTDRSRKQLSDALARRGIPADVAEAALDRFAGLGLVDDARFAEVLVRTRLAEKHASKRAISEELRRKGVAPDIVEQATRGIGEDEELANAVAFAVKKLRIASGKPETLDRRTYAALARRGFSPSLCSRALAEAKRRREAGEDGRDPDAAWGCSMFGYETGLGL